MRPARRLFAAIERIALTAFLCGLGQRAIADGRAALTLPRTMVPVPIEGSSVSAPMWGTATVETSGDRVILTLDVTADLAEVATKMAEALRGRLQRNDDCDQVLRPHTISLTPSGRSARLYVGAHFEQWACPWTEVLGQRIEGGKHKVVEQDGDVSVDVVPTVVDGALVLRTENVAFHLNGVMGALMGVDAVRDWIATEVRNAIPSTLLTAAPRDLLPNELRQFNPVLRSLDFAAVTNGALGVHFVVTTTAHAADVARAYAR